MARSLRDIRRKMKAIKSTRQVTKAMELVSASKMRKAVENAQTLRRYAGSAWNIMERIAAVHPELHPFLQQRPPHKILAVLITSDRGLCGSLNTQLFRTATQYMQQVKQLPGFEKIDFIAVGRKGQQFLARTQQTIVAAFPAYSNHPSFRDIVPVSKLAFDSFKKGDYDHIVLLYPNFISALAQEPTAKVLLPFSPSELKKLANSLHTAKKQEKNDEPAIAEYLFEPSPMEVLEAILPQLTEVQVYQSILEAAASEHSARMVAMRNASDNASDIIDDLTLTYNQTRQANITGELAELSAATAALG